MIRARTTSNRLGALSALVVLLPSLAGAAKPAKDDGPTPAGGFTLEPKKFGVKVELGYPFFVFRLSRAARPGVELFVGYRGFYSLLPSVFAGVKLRLATNKARTFGFSIKALGGWSYQQKYQDFATSNAGGAGGFGEIWLMFTGRRGRHGMFVNGGGRVSQVLSCTQDLTSDDECDGHILAGDKGVVGTLFSDFGYEVRLTKNTTFYIGMGADMFLNSKDWPFMYRFRTGMIMEF